MAAGAREDYRADQSLFGEWRVGQGLVFGSPSRLRAHASMTFVRGCIFVPKLVTRPSVHIECVR